MMRSHLLVSSAIVIPFLAAWFFSSFAGENESFHPFRSENAKQMYLEYYDQRAKSMPGESAMVPTSFGDTHVRVSGPLGASPLVLLPGDSETMLSWEPQLPTLSEHYRTYAIDNVYDFGKSVYTHPMKVPGDYVQWLEQVFVALDIDKAHLVGFSYGGWQASLFALDHPERLISLILIAPSATVIAPGWELLVRGILQWVFPTKWILTNYLYWYNADSVQQGRVADVDEMVEEVLLSTSCFKRRSFIPPTVLTNNEWLQLARSPATLVLVGENDVTYPVSAPMERLAQFDIATTVISNAGHDLRTLQTDRVNQEILSFLQSADS